MLIDTGTNIGQLNKDIIRAAEIVGVPCNEKAIERVLDVYQDLFAKGAVAFRTTSHAPGKRDLAVRYMDLATPHDPFKMAVESGLLKLTGHPVEAVFPEVQARFPKIGYGVDASVRYGLQKIWPFFLEPVPLQDLLSLQSMPTSMKNYADSFVKFGLTMVGLLAIDYPGKTVNVYFMIKHPELFSPEKIAAMIEDAGFKVPSQDELEISSKPFVIYHTFGWDSPRIERLCFGMAAPAEGVPTHMHPIFKRVVDDIPIRGNRRQFTYNTTYGARGDYLKIEADYHASVDQVLGCLFSGLH